jgi:hypothetical protein
VKKISFGCLLLCAVVAAGVPPSASAQTPAAPSLSKELAATWQRAATEIVDIAEAMPEEKLSDAQLLEPVKFPFGDRTVTRVTFWEGPLYQIRNHHGQLVVYLRMNGVVPPTTARRPR